MLTRSPFKHRILPVIAAAILIAVAAFASKSSMQELHSLRALERVPVSPVAGVLPGPTQLHGYAEAINRDRLTTPNTKTKVLAYKWTKERQYTDSEGKKRWRIEKSEYKFIDFKLFDGQHSILVKTSGAAKNTLSLHQRWQDRQGDLRYTEYWLQHNEPIQLYGHINSANEVELQHRAIEPLLTMGTTNSARQSKAGFMLFKFWGAWLAIALAITSVLYALNQHRILVFLGVITASGVIYLSSLSLTMMKSELSAAHQLTMSQYGSLMADADAQGIDIKRDIPEEGTPLAAKYATLEQRFIQYENVAQRFPLSLLSGLWGIKSLPPLARSGTEYDMSFSDSALTFGFIPYIALGSGVLGVVLLLLGISLVKEKRQIEAIETSPAGGAVYGQGEFSGHLHILGDDRHATVKGPLSHIDCLWFDYKEYVKVKTKNGHSWKQVDHQTDCRPMLIKDDSGEIALELDDAKIITKTKHKRISGDRKYVEQNLVAGDEVYVLGSAEVVDHRDHQLTIVKGKDQPMIVSDFGEFDVIMMQAGKGILSLMIGAMLILGGLLLGFAITGSLTPFDLLKTALMCPVLLLGVMVTLHYNDLVFLRERTKRAWANIQVSLKKRADLLPNLQSVLSETLKHERSTLNAITAMRTQLTKLKSVNDIKRFNAFENKVNKLIEAKIEAYPDLKSDANVTQLMHQLRQLEDEIEYMRAGYVDAAALYNTRLQTVPDIWIARMGKFERASMQPS